MNAPPNKSLDVRAKQRLCLGVVRQTQTGLVVVSPHVISIVRQLQINSTVTNGKAQLMNVHEEPFASAFIMPEKRDRYLSMLDSKRGRKKLRDGLYHCRDLDKRFAHLVPTGKQSSDSIERVLQSKGAPDKCYIFSADDKFDGREMPLTEALFWIVGSNSGTFSKANNSKL